MAKLPERLQNRVLKSTSPGRSVPVSVPASARARTTDQGGNDYIDPPEPQKKSLCLVFSNTGEGKTTFGLKHVPGPVAYHDVDCRGFHACKEARSEGKIVKYLPLDYPKHIESMSESEAMAAARISVDKHWKNMEWSVRASERGDIRTITWDTGSELAQLINITFTGRPERRNDDFGASGKMVELELAKMIKIVRTEGNANLVILAHHKEVWETTGTTASGKAKREATGKYTFEGPKVLAGAVDWAGHLRLMKTSVKSRGSEKAKRHELEITKSGVILPFLGEVWNDEQWDEYGPFAFACGLLYPDSSATEWTE